MPINIFALVVAAASTLVMGFVWYHPKVFGKIWMRGAGLTEADLKSGKPAVIFPLALVFAFMVALNLSGVVVHQMGAIQLTGGDVENALPSFKSFMDDYGSNFRTARHGALHGLIFGLGFVFPIIATLGIFERRKWSLILVNSGFWVVCLVIMGAIICAWQ